MTIRLFKPDIFVEKVVDIPAQFLRDRGRTGLLLDIDGTLKNFHDARVSPGVVNWMNRLRNSGVRICLLSNGRTNRIAKLAADLDLPFVAQAFKPFPYGCRKAVRILNLACSDVALAGDQLFADHLAGRLAGLFTILVRPTSQKEPWFTRLKRPIESMLTSSLVPDNLNQYQPENTEPLDQTVESSPSRVEH